LAYSKQWNAPIEIYSNTTGLKEFESIINNETTTNLQVQQLPLIAASFHLLVKFAEEISLSLTDHGSGKEERICFSCCVIKINDNKVCPT
jgi:hypothetical protein